MKIPDVAIAPAILRDPSAPAADGWAAVAADPSLASVAQASADGAQAGDPAFAAQADQALGKINATLEMSSVSVRFEMDPKADRMVTQVVDVKSGEVIRQIPSEVAIRISKALDKLQGLLVHEQG
jgi:flagellar protein FlaG